MKQLYNMDLHISTSTTETLSLHVQIHLHHITTQEQSNTVKCLHPGSDIMEHLEEHVYNEILEFDSCLFDSGAEISCMNMVTVATLGLMSQITPSSISVNTVNGDHMGVAGDVWVNFKIGEKIFFYT